jgi:hypothetical protein
MRSSIWAVEAGRSHEWSGCAACSNGTIAGFQKFVDFAVSKGIVPEPVDVRNMIKPL